MRNKQSTLSIFQYDDYRKYISDILVERKALKLPSSFRWIAQICDFTSPNAIHLVIKEKRHLSLDAARKMASGLNLNKDEARYFLNLVQFTKAETSEDRAHFAAEMLKSNNSKGITPLRKDQFEYYSSWYIIAVREYLTIPGAAQSSDQIAKEIIPSLKPFEVEEALKTLVRLGMIKKGNSRWKVLDTNLGFGNKITRTGLIRFHQKMMELGSESMDRFSSQERDITGATTKLSKQSLVKIKDMITDLRKEILKLSEADSSADQIFQLSVQLFPLSKKVVSNE